MAITDDELHAALRAESDRRQAWFVEMREKHPERTRAMVFAFLGDAIAYADLWGCDVDAFLRELRRSEPRAVPLPAAFSTLRQKPRGDR